ncbi:MAG: ABC transporter permease [Nitrospirae bacterium]|jgi:phospholipid/cholesterol/gamma-HCH transport system permease protein|nr:ABC transporter permease [Nitrospirota bacterium]
MIDPFEFVLGILGTIQSFTLMVARAFRYLVVHFRFRESLLEMDRLGVGSIPIVFLANLFAGLDMALQFSVVMAPYGATNLLGKVVATSVIRDMGPVLASLVMSARVTAGITSELGMMSTTQQIEALLVMGVDPVDRLVAPKILAGMVMLPVLSVVGDFLGVLAGLAVAMFGAHVAAPLYWSGVRTALTPPNLVNGIVKPFVFGFILVSIGCFYGLRTTGGAQGVGRATTKAVVYAAIWILIANFLISKLLIDVWGWSL